MALDAELLVWYILLCQIFSCPSRLSSRLGPSALRGKDNMDIYSTKMGNLTKMGYSTMQIFYENGMG